MKSFKLLILIFLSMLITGCAGMLAGNYYEEPVIENGQVAKTVYGTVIKKKTRTARSVSIMQSASTAIEKMATVQPGNRCMSLTFEQINQLKADAQAAYIQGANNCNMFAAMERTVSQALGRAQSPQEAVARQFVSAVRASENGLTGRIKAIANPLAVTIGVKSIAKSFENVGIAAAKTGNTTVGNISVSDSGDTGGEGGFSPTGSTNLTIGDGNSITTAQGASTAGRNVLTPDNSSNGSITDDSKTQGAQTSETIEDGAEVEDDDGISL